MKKYILLIIPMIFLQLSCKKTLDPVVTSSLTSANAFLTESDAIAAVNAVYGRLKGPSVGDNYFYWTVGHTALTDLASDIGHTRYVGDVYQLTIGQWDATNQLFNNEWQSAYKLIADANNAILNISAMKSITDVQKTQFLSELKFLRAISYMDLTDSWGPVPLVTEKEVANPNYLGHIAPSPVATIEALLISDLTAAANALPVDYTNNPIYTTNDVGRATKGAALTELAKIYLRQHQWQSVVDATQKVMALGVYQLYPSYVGLFKESNKWCSENIFSVLCDANVNGAELLNHFGPYHHPVVQNRWQYFAVSWDFYNSFDNNDDRKQLFYPQYTDTEGLLETQAPSLGATPPPGVIYNPDVSTMKYADPNGSTSYYDGHSVDILRYADVLMSRAEALNELNGPTTESVNLITQVKNRSHAPLLTLAGLTQSTLRDAILQERGWEFFYEGKRRPDLLRMGKYDVIVNAYLKRIGQSANIVLPKNQYFPYPQNQVAINPLLNNSSR